jgi:hypothetical protein
MYMNRPVATALNLCAGWALLAAAGCFGGPTAMKAPPIDPDKTADAALAQYDTNGDRLLGAQELTNCPALRDALHRLDRDKDNQISRDELAARLEMWAKGGIGASTLACRVSKGKRSLAGAQVQLIPEEFFQGVLQPASGTTNKSGIAVLSIDQSNLPSDLQNFRGVQQGFYRVEITHPELEIPPQYNSKTTLGIEVSFETGRNYVEFNI